MASSKTLQRCIGIINTNNWEFIPNRVLFLLCLNRKWNENQSKSKRCSLLAVIVVTFWKDYVLLAALGFTNEIILRLGQQLLLGRLLLYFRTASTTTYRNALIYASGIVVMNGIYAVISNHIMFRSLHYGMKIRVAVCSLIYRKVTDF